MPTNIQVASAAAAYAMRHEVPIPKVNYHMELWGTGKRALAWAVSGHMNKHGLNVPQSAKRTQYLVAALFPHEYVPLHILHPDYHWNGMPVKRDGPPPGVVWHHTVGSGTPEQIHAQHLAIGDRGIAYHFYVRRDGKVYAGRPEYAMGAHTYAHNDWIGVAAEGNYDVTTTMPDAQLQSMRALHHYLTQKYHVPDRMHKNMPLNHTACPGRYYPFAKITS